MFPIIPNNIIGNSQISTFPSATPAPKPAAKPASDTPVEVLTSYGLDPEKARQECEGLRKFLSGQAPAKRDFPAMLLWLERELQGDAGKCAGVMVAIQKSHPQFVPMLYYRGPMTGEFHKEFNRLAATVFGLKVCAPWSETCAQFVAPLLEHPDCSICTLDFSQMYTNSCWDLAFTKNTSVKTWLGCPLNWVGLQFIGRHVHELRLRSAKISDSEALQLQNILQKGHIDCVGFKSAYSEAHLRLAQIVNRANNKGGRVQQVHLQGMTDYKHAPEIMKTVFGSKYIVTVTLPNLECLRSVSTQQLKAMVANSTVESLDLAIVPVLVPKANAREETMAEITPSLTLNRQLTAIHIGASATGFSMTAFNGLVIDELSSPFQASLTRFDSDATRMVNKTAYTNAVDRTNERNQAVINRFAMVPYVPLEFNSPGAKVNALMQGTIDCPLAQLGPWLVEGLKEGSADIGDLDELEQVLLRKFATAIDAAFAAADAQPNQPQVTDPHELHRVIRTLFGPDSTATFASLPQDLSSELAGVVPDQRERFKSLLLLSMRSKLQDWFAGLYARV